MSKITILNNSRDIEKKIISIEQDPVTPPTIQTTVGKLRVEIAKIEKRIEFLGKQKDELIDILEQVNNDVKIPYDIPNIPVKVAIK